MRNIGIKTLALTLAAAISAGVLAGCGASGASSAAPASSAASSAAASSAAPAESKPAASGEKITLSFIRAGTDERAQKAYEDLIAAYTAENPNVTIDYQQYNFGAELETKMNTLYASGSAPDIVRAPISTIAQRATMGQYAALDSYIDAWDEKDNIIDNAYGVGSYKDHRYGIAVNIEASFLFYRKDHFEAAGLDPANPPKTWEELSDYAEKLTVREGNNVTRAGFSFPMSLAHITIIPFARQNGGLLVDEEKDEAVFNEPQTAEALDYLATYSARNLLIPYINNKDQNPFEVGNASMTIASFNTFNTIKQSGVDWTDQIMFAPMVSKVKQSGFGGCQIMFLSEDGKHKDDSWEFMKYLFTDESVWKMVTEAGASPVKEALSDRFAQEFPDIGPVYLDALTYAQGMPKVEWAALFEKYLCIAYEEAMYGKKDAQTALDDALQQLNSELGR